MQQSPSWEANGFAASQEIPRILWNPKVHYRIHMCPPPVPILIPLDPVHNPTSYFLKTHLNIIILSVPESSKWSLSLRFPNQNPVYASPLSHTRYIPRPSHYSRFYHSKNNGWGVQHGRLWTGFGWFGSFELMAVDCFFFLFYVMWRRNSRPRGHVAS